VCAGAAPFVDTFLDDTMAKYGLDESKTVLVGFSQGTMMALHVGLRRATPLAGIIGFSGMLAAADALGAEIKSRPPVLLLHGDSDQMLPHQLTERATEVLRQHGVNTTMHIAEGVGHGIDESGLSHAARFLLEASSCRCPRALPHDEDRRHLQTRLRAHRRGLRAQLRRTRRGRCVGFRDRRRRDRRRPVGRLGPPGNQRAVDQGHGRHRLLLHQGRHGALRARAGEPRPARPRCAGDRAVARVRPERQGARDPHA
jgi:hypothetical protein